MAETIKNDLSGQQIKFMNFWEGVVLLNKTRITSDMLDVASKYLNIKRSGNCSICMKNDAIEFNNRYKLLLPLYQQYKLSLEELTVDIKKIKDDFNNDISEIENQITTSTTTKRKMNRKKK